MVGGWVDESNFSVTFGPNLKTKTLLRPRPKLNNYLFSSEEDSAEVDHIEKNQMSWLEVLIGMIILIICNACVVIGIIFNFHLLLLPWLVVYIIGTKRQD